MNDDKQLKTSIMEKISQKKPINKIYFQGTKFFIVLSIIILLIISSVLFGFLIWDIFGLAKIDFLFLGFYEWFFLFLFLIFLIYIIYRQTDFFLVKRRYLIFLIFIILGIILGFSLVFISNYNKDVENNFEQLQTNFERLPFRDTRRKMIEEKMQKNNVWQGRVVKIIYNLNKEDLKDKKIKDFVGDNLDLYSLVSIQNRDSVKMFLFEKQKFNFELSDRVLIQFDQKNMLILNILRKN